MVAIPRVICVTVFTFDVGCVILDAIFVWVCFPFVFDYTF